MAEALPLIADAAAHFPRAPEFVISQDQLGDTEIFDARRAQAEIGAVQLGRGEYAAALDTLLHKRRWRG